MTSKTDRSVHVRPALAEDAPKISEIRSVQSLHLSDHLSKADTAAMVERFHSAEAVKMEIKNDDKRTFVACLSIETIASETSQKDRVVGTASINMKPNHLPSVISTNYAHLMHIFVDAAQQGHGVGTALLNTVEDCAAKAGKTALTLLVDKPNVRAKQLYERQGFVIRAELLGADGEAGRESWVMEKNFD